MRFLDLTMRAVFAGMSLVLMLLAIGLLAYAAIQILGIFRQPETDVGAVLLAAIGYSVIALAVFEVAKYLFEEEVINPREMRHTGEARRGMTKFISTIAIAVFLEALVAVFAAGKDQMENMLYPTFLLFAGVALVVGLGAYQRLSTLAETEVGEEQADPAAEVKTPPRVRRAGPH